MNRVARRNVASLLAFLIAGSLLAVGPTVTLATTTNSMTHGLAPGSSAAPVDPSGITFRAYRSYDLAFVPGVPFSLEVMKSQFLPTGPLHFAELLGDNEVDLGLPTWHMGGTVNGVPYVFGTLVVPGATEGTHVYLAVFEATEDWDRLTLSITVDVARAATTVTVATPVNPVQTQRSIDLYAWVGSTGSGIQMTGTVEWRDVDANTVLGTRSVDDPYLMFSSPVGVRHLTASYSGDDLHAPSTSSVFVLTVIPDQVETTGVGVQYTSFYPFTDGYRDTVAIRGTRHEPISVAIKVYNSTGTLVKSLSVARATGTYSTAWNGRNSAGAILASGKYKVVQTLTDAMGSTKAFTHYVTLSPKKLVTYTKYVEKAGSAVAAKGAGDGGAVSTSSTGGYAKLAAGNGWALAGWEFPIPAATVYKSISFQVYAKAPLAVPPTLIGLQRVAWPRAVDTWYETWFDPWTTIGNATGSLAWHSAPGSTSSVARSGRSVQVVRGMIAVQHGTVYVYKARAKVVYAILQ